MPHTKNINLLSLMDTFHSEEHCREHLEGLRWGDDIHCPRCNSSSIARIHTRGQLDCNDCRYRFSVTSGTIFHDSHLPLRKWFVAVYLMCEARKGVSANQLKRTLKVAYKTAWYLCHRIRAAMKDADSSLLEGTVEVDETYVGGKAKNMSKAKRKAARESEEGFRKSMVLGAIERGGSVRLQVEQHADRKTLHGFIRQHTAPDAKAIYTDAWEAYQGIEDHDTAHETVNHSADEWVRGDVHTNTVESAFSLFKRSIVGAYHQISAKHLPAYLDEFEFRFDNRKNPYLFRDTLLKLLEAKALPYEQLTA